VKSTRKWRASLFLLASASRSWKRAACTSPRLVLFLTAFVAASAVAAVEPGPSGAVCIQLGNGHCYGIISWYPNGTYTGGSALIETSKLGPQSSSQFSANRIFVCDLNPHCYWGVEEGWGIGARQNPDIPGTSLAYYWADTPFTGCANYMEHYAGYPTPILGQAHRFKISNNGNGSWEVFFDGTAIAASTRCHDYSSGAMEAGGEITTATNTDDGESYDLQKRGANGSWTYNWGGSTLYCTGPFYIAWVQTYQNAVYATDAGPPPPSGC